MSTPPSPAPSATRRSPCRIGTSRWAAQKRRWPHQTPMNHRTALPRRSGASPPRWDAGIDSLGLFVVRAKKRWKARILFAYHWRVRPDRTHRANTRRARLPTNPSLPKGVRTKYEFRSAMKASRVSLRTISSTITPPSRSIIAQISSTEAYFD